MFPAFPVVQRHAWRIIRYHECKYAVDVKFQGLICVLEHEAIELPYTVRLLQSLPPWVRNYHSRSDNLFTIWGPGLRCLLVSEPRMILEEVELASSHHHNSNFHPFASGMFFSKHGCALPSPALVSTEASEHRDNSHSPHVGVGTQTYASMVCEDLNASMSFNVL